LYVEGGQTSLFDAVDYAVKYLSKNRPVADRGLPTLILISSGEDRSNSKSIDDALSAIKEQQVRVFTIGLSDLKVSTRSLDRLSKENGGKAYVPRTTAEISNAVIDILKLMRGVTAGK
jgi:Mg-chelatase subunit ChlD